MARSAVLSAILLVALCAANDHDSWQETETTLIPAHDSDDAPIGLIDDTAQEGWGNPSPPSNGGWFEQIQKKAAEGAAKVKAKVVAEARKAAAAAKAKIDETKQKVAQRAKMLRDKIKEAGMKAKAQGTRIAKATADKLKKQWDTVKSDAKKTVGAAKAAAEKTAKAAIKKGKEIAKGAVDAVKAGCKLPSGADKAAVDKAIEDCKNAAVGAAKDGIDQAKAGAGEIANEAKEKAGPIANEAKTKAEAQASTAKETMEKAKAEGVKAGEDFGGAAKEAGEKTVATTQLLAVEAGQKSERINSDAYWNEIDLDLLQTHMDTELAELWGEEEDDWLQLDDL